MKLKFVRKSLCVYIVTGCDGAVRRMSFNGSWAWQSPSEANSFVVVHGCIFICDHAPIYRLYLAKGNGGVMKEQGGQRP